MISNLNLNDSKLFKKIGWGKTRNVYLNLEDKRIYKKAIKESNYLNNKLEYILSNKQSNNCFSKIFDRSKDFEIISSEWCYINIKDYKEICDTLYKSFYDLIFIKKVDYKNEKEINRRLFGKEDFIKIFKFFKNIYDKKYIKDDDSFKKFMGEMVTSYNIGLNSENNFVIIDCGLDYYYNENYLERILKNEI